jgi:hypothetical protein
VALFIYLYEVIVSSAIVRLRYHSVSGLHCTLSVENKMDKVISILARIAFLAHTIMK